MNPPTWKQYQEEPKLLVWFEPDKSEIEAFPFLDRIGGLLTKYRHPYLIHYCNAYNVMKASAAEIRRLKSHYDRRKDEFDANEENWKPSEFSRRQKELVDVLNEMKRFATKGQECIAALTELKEGKVPGLRVEDICYGGKYFNVSDDERKAIDEMMTPLEQPLTSGHMADVTKR